MWAILDKLQTSLAPNENDRHPVREMKHSGIPARDGFVLRFTFLQLPGDYSDLSGFLVKW